MKYGLGSQVNICKPGANVMILSIFSQKNRRNRGFVNTASRIGSRINICRYVEVAKITIVVVKEAHFYLQWWNVLK